MTRFHGGDYYTTLIFTLFSSSNNHSKPPTTKYSHSTKHTPMFSLIFLLLIFSILFLIFKKLKKTKHTHEPNSTQLTNSLLLEILPSTLLCNEVCDDPGDNGSGLEKERTDSSGENKKRKKRAKKKRPNNGGEEKGDGGEKREEELICYSLYPFTTSSSATQRKIKQQYDHLVKSHGSNGLTLAQVGQFVNCLIEARNELQHKSEVIQRKFPITKALLLKADRSSFDRLSQQIYKLELEQKRLEEDAFVYNWLQQQLKLSPAYKKMLEICDRAELKAKSGELIESTETDFTDISFEELLAQEKKDSFWQRNGKLRSCSG